MKYVLPIVLAAWLTPGDVHAQVAGAVATVDPDERLSPADEEGEPQARILEYGGRIFVRDTGSRIEPSVERGLLSELAVGWSTRSTCACGPRDS